MKDLNPQISLWRRAVCAISLIPRKSVSYFSKTNKKPRPGPGSGAHRTVALRPSRHDSPNDPLAGHSDYVAFEGPKHRVHSLLTSSYNYNTTYGAPGRIRTCVHFVRSEGHPSPLARTLNCLVRADGFEPPTTRSQGECASRLRYTRTILPISTAGGCPRYRTGLSGFSDQRFHLISLAAARFCRVIS